MLQCTCTSAQVCFLRFFIAETEAEFSPRVNEFEILIGGSLHVAVEKNIMLYYSAMVAEVKESATDTV